MQRRSIAIIGSFRRYNAQIQDFCAKLRVRGITVTSPQGVDVIDRGVACVRFPTDNSAWTADAAVQSLVLRRILRADLVYALLPEGYIGRTACYEVGRVVQAHRPIYFSCNPVDLPQHVPKGVILVDSELLLKLLEPEWSPRWPFECGHRLDAQFELAIASGSSRHD